MPGSGTFIGTPLEEKGVLWGKSTGRVSQNGHSTLSGLSGISNRSWSTDGSASGKGFDGKVFVGAFICWPSGHECGVAQALVGDRFSGVQQVLIWFLEVCDHSGWASTRTLVGKSWSASDRSSGSEKD